MRCLPAQAGRLQTESRAGDTASSRSWSAACVLTRAVCACLSSCCQHMQCSVALVGNEGLCHRQQRETRVWLHCCCPPQARRDRQGKREKILALPLRAKCVAHWHEQQLCSQGLCSEVGCFLKAVVCGRQRTKSCRPVCMCVIYYVPLELTP